MADIYRIAATLLIVAAALAPAACDNAQKNTPEVTTKRLEDGPADTASAGTKPVVTPAAAQATRR